MRTSFSAALFAVSCALGAVLPSAGAGQEQEAAPADPAGDLRIIKERAAQDPEVAQYFSSIFMVGGTDQQPSRRESMVQQLIRMAFGSRGNPPLPVDVEMFARIQPAIERARFVSGVLAADLDGDWQITQRELKVALQSPYDNGNTGRAAEAFVLGDADGNGILSVDEIRAYVATKEDMWRRPSRMSGRFLGVFDLDGDGTVTRVEYDRAVTALRG